MSACHSVDIKNELHLPLTSLLINYDKTTPKIRTEALQMGYFFYYRFILYN